MPVHRVCAWQPQLRRVWHVAASSAAYAQVTLVRRQPRGQRYGSQRANLCAPRDHGTQADMCCAWETPESRRFEAVACPPLTVVTAAEGLPGKLVTRAMRASSVAPTLWTQPLGPDAHGMAVVSRGTARLAQEKRGGSVPKCTLARYTVYLAAQGP